MSRSARKDWNLDTLLSVVGFVFELTRVIVNALRKHNGTIDHLRRLIKEPDLVDRVFDLIVPVGSVPVKPISPNEYLIPVGDKVFLVKHFNREIMSEDAIAEMDKLGYRPATHIETYSFQKARPDLHRQFWIVALGSFAMHDDGECVAVLDSGSGRRIFGRSWFDGGWDARNRFLFVRK
ncbi:hypothetical protein HYV69_00195 [Candidatus Uhrbacteria bacterium]|nr:hypothetical protein [Candidatus Uhrbacteria bacterium]